MAELLHFELCNLSSLKDITSVAGCISWWGMRVLTASLRMRLILTEWTASSGQIMGYVSSQAARTGRPTSGILNASVGAHSSCSWAPSCLGKWIGLRCLRMLQGYFLKPETTYQWHWKIWWSWVDINPMFSILYVHVGKISLQWLSLIFVLLLGYTQELW